MVDKIFGALASHPRRTMLRYLAERPLSVSQLAEHFQLTFAAVSKHVGVLQASGLVVQTREGRVRICRLNPGALEEARKAIEQIEQVAAQRLDGLQSYLQLTGRTAPPPPPPRRPPRGPRRRR